MNGKGILLVSFLILVLLSMSSVNASDLDNATIQASDDTIDDVNPSDEFDFLDINVASEDKTIQSSDDASNEENSQGIVSSASNNEILGTSFTDLQGYINGADEGGLLVLDDDYSIGEGGHTLLIEKSLTIDGAGHSLTGDDSSTILCINAREKSVILKNITFWHGGSSDEGGAILNNRSSTNLTIIDCIFYFNSADAGGAIYSYGNLVVNGSTFEKSNATGGDGGAIHCEKDLHVSNSEFSDNSAGNLKLNVHSGGAIYSKGKCYIESCAFYTNTAKDGSAIYSCGDLRITGCTGGNIFTKNSASFSTIYGEKNVYVNWDNDSNWTCTMQFNTHESTGAIRCQGNLYAQLLNMYKNEAGGGPDLGVAIYCEGETHVNSSEFKENIYTPKPTVAEFTLYEAHGGAIWSKGKCYIDSCQFYANYALIGGAIYACDDLRITGKNNVFKDNQLDKEGKAVGIAYDKDGGAIYCCGNLFVNNTDFINNSATIDGGAIYCKKECSLYNCEFNSNIVTGALARCSYGGAICTDKLGIVNNCSFYSNNANPSIGTDCYGGAVYIISKCDPEFISCIFDENECQMRGGAIYTDSENTNLKLINSSFYHNVADVDGGAIYCKGKTTLSGCEFRYDRAKGSSIYEGSFGGSVYSLESVTVDDSKFENCHANNIGGAIYTKGEIKVTNSNFTKNTVKVDGGAIYADGKTTISNCIFNGNEATGEVSGVKSYGGAVRSNGFATVKNSTFDDNFAYNLGGAIYVDGGIDIIGCNFSGNIVYVDGGAVYAEGETYIYNSKFEKNRATGKTSARSFGGAVRSNGDTTVEICLFEDNYAYNNGGALYSNKETTIKKSTFTDNEANDDGGAVYSEDDAIVSDSMFNGNSVDGNTSRRAFGGGICSYGKVILNHTNFYDNYADNRGGAVFAFTEIEIKECTFIRNYAQYYGGAVYTRTINRIVSDSIFNDNHVNNDGGAIYINNSCEPEFSSCSFDSNGANDRGGAIYVDSKNAPLKLSSSTFKWNEAGQGGAIYTGTMSGRTTYSLFIRNEATSGDGGAIYINNKCDAKFYSCRFEQNECKDRGGAIYLDSSNADLYLGYCTFVDNKAGNKGRSVFNCGYYKEIIQCWLGENNPSLKDQFKEWHDYISADTDFTDFTPAYIYMAISNPLTPYIGNSYHVAVRFLDAEYQYYDLLHSSAKFYGDNVKISNESVDMNDMTAEVIFTDHDPTIKLKLDHQVVSLSPRVREKHTSKVIITSCEDIDYPNALVVDYEIINMTDNATYVIIDENSGSGNVVREGKISSPKSTLTIENLNPGKYYIRIDNHEDRTTGSSRAIARFTVYMLVSANVTADNVTYGNPTTITLSANYDGVYNVSVNGENIEMEVVNGISIKQVKFDVGEYQTHTSYIGNYTKFNCNEALFAVFKGSNNVVVSVEDVRYGTPSVIRVEADVDGIYTVDVNGALYNVTVTNGVGNKSLVLDAGRYYANVTFDNKNYNTTAHNTTFTVHKADVDLVVVVFDEVYGDEIECLVYASRDGDYNLTIGDYQTIVTVKDSFAYYEHTTLDAGTYQATASFAGDRNYNPAFNITTFTVYPAGTSFELKIIPDEILYGENATVTHRLPDGATGNITYYLSNGTFLGVLDLSDNLTLDCLDVGTYMVIGNYSGDHNFIPATDSTFLTVRQAPNNVFLSASNVTYGNETLIEVSADVDGIYQLDLNGTLYNVNIQNGIGNKTIALNAGKYYANVTFMDKNYNTIATNAIFEVYKADVNLIILASDIRYPQELEGVISSDVDGKYNLTLGDRSTVISVNGGSGNFNLGVLDAGAYEIIANYSGDANHNPASYKLAINVSPAPNNAVVTVANVTYGNDSLIEVLADVDGTYQVDVNGSIYNVTVTNGAGSISLALDAGIYYANISFEDKNYNTTVHNASFEVYKASNMIFVVAYHCIYPEEIEGIVVADVDGEYNLTIGEYSSTIIIEDGFTKFNAGVFDAGNYTVFISYPGDRNHMANSSSDDVTVFKYSPEIILNVEDIDYGGVAVISISSDVPGTVNVTVNGITETIDLNGQNRKLLFASLLGASTHNASLSLYNLDSGIYPVRVAYNGDNNYESVIVSDEFNVNPLNVTMDVDANDIKVGDEESITVKLSPEVNGTVTVTVDGKNYTAQLKDGKATFNILGLSAGKKNAEVYYSGDTNYNPAKANVSFTVNKIKPNISVSSNEPYAGKKIHITVTVPKDASGTVTISLEGKNYTAPVKNGKAVFNIPGLKAGKYDFTAYYSGDDKYEEAQIDSSITVKEEGGNDDNHTDDNGGNDKNHTNEKHSSGNDIGLKSTGNPIFVLLLSLMAITLTGIRRFKK